MARFGCILAGSSVVGLIILVPESLYIKMIRNEWTAAVCGAVHEKRCIVIAARLVKDP